jgi:23S rRNA (uracil1939-C5)-methyltransferase
MADPWRYRNKAVLHGDREGRLGYYKEKTKEVVPFDDCLLLSRNTNERIRKLKALLVKSRPGITTVTLRESNRGKGLLLLEGNTGRNTREQQGLEQLLRELRQEEIFSPQLCSIAVPRDDKDFAGSGAQFFNEHLADLRFKVSPRAFLQVNAGQSAKLYGMVLDWAELSGREAVWDLYCGIGTMTLLLAPKARQVVGVEENPYAVQDAEENARDNKIGNVRFIQGKVEDKIKGLAQAQVPDLVVTDPPRAGMDPVVVQRLLQVGPEKIIYVSCNPATLARDLKLLVAGNENGARGYKIKKVQPVDMFPWTGHVENCVLLSKKEIFILN